MKSVTTDDYELAKKYFQTVRYNQVGSSIDLSRRFALSSKSFDWLEVDQSSKSDFKTGRILNVPVPKVLISNNFKT